MEIKPGKNNFLWALLFFAAACAPPAFGGWRDKAPETYSSGTGDFRVYYKLGEAEKKPEQGKGKFREISYKAVYQEDWQPSKNRKFEVLFLDKDGYYVVRDVVLDKKFGKRGEYYGFVSVSEKDSKRITGAEVREIKKKVPPPAPPEPAVVETPKPKARKTGPKGVFGKGVITDEIIRAELEKTGRAKKDEPEKTEDEGEEEVDPEAADVTAALEG